MDFFCRPGNAICDTEIAWTENCLYDFGDCCLLFFQGSECLYCSCPDNFSPKLLDYFAVTAIQRPEAPEPCLSFHQCYPHQFDHFIDVYESHLCHRGAQACCKPNNLFGEHILDEQEFCDLWPKDKPKRYHDYIVATDPWDIWNSSSK